MDKFKKFAPIIAAVFGFIALMMLFAASVVVKEGGEAYVGWQVAFGYKEKFGSLSHGVFKFSFLNFLPYFFVLCGIACSVVAFIKKDVTMFAFGAAALFGLAAILFFFPVAGLQFAGMEDASKEFVARLRDLFKIGVGTIIAALCSIAAAGCAVAPTILEKMGK